MKSRTLRCITAMTLFAALAVPVQLAAQNTRYKIVDLGTLGGPQSVVANFGTKLLNNRGTVAGCADTSTTNPNYPNYPNRNGPFGGFSPPLPDPFVFHTFLWHEGNITDLGALPGINNSCPIWITESGLVAGFSENGVIDPVSGSPEVRATLWKNDEVVDLGTFGGSESVALVANSRGQVVGAAANTIPDSFSLFGGFSTETRAFLWQNGVLKDLSTLGGPDAYAAGINEAGEIAGSSYTNSTPNPTTGSPTLAPFRWKEGKMTNLGSLGGTMSLAFNINNRGQVMGQSNLPGDPGCPNSCQTHGFLWDRGVLKDLGSFGGSVTPEWMDDAGEVVGNVQLTGTNCFQPLAICHAFLWKDGRMTDLGTLPGDVGSNAINASAGRVVGVSGDASGNVHGFLWDRGGPMVDLSALIPGDSALQPMVPFVINVRAEIAGIGVLSDGNLQGFLMIPCGRGTEGCTSDAASGTTTTHGNSTLTMAQRLALRRVMEGSRARLAERYRIPGMGRPRD